MQPTNVSQKRAFLTLNEAIAAEAGKSQIIDKTGGYDFTIAEAIFVTADNGTMGIQLSGEDAAGLKGNYITIYYQKKDGTILKGGQALIQAIMYIEGIKETSFIEATADDGAKYWKVPELEGVKTGLVLERQAYTKRNSTDKAWSLNVRQVYQPSSGATVEEIQEGRQAEAVAKLIEQLQK